MNRVWTIRTAILKLAYSSNLLLVQTASAAAVTRHAIQTKGPDHSVLDRSVVKQLYGHVIKCSLAVIAQALTNVVHMQVVQVAVDMLNQDYYVNDEDTEAVDAEDLWLCHTCKRLHQQDAGEPLT